MASNLVNGTRSMQLSPLSAVSGKYYLILFLVWPFLAFITALFNYNRNDARRVVYFFIIYYGLTFVIFGEGYVDAAGYAMELEANAALPFSDFFKIIGGLYAADSSLDVLEPFLSFVVSRFTADHRVLFAIFAAIFGFYYLRSINLLYNRYAKNPGLNSGIHLAFFCVILTVTAINGFRMWTAAWIFFYGAFQVIVNRERKYLFFAMASVLVHWSFISANLILVIYYFAGNRNIIYLPLAILSFVVPNLITPLFQMMSIRFGGAIQNRFESYSSEAYVLSRQESIVQSAWFLRIGNDLVFYYMLTAIIVIQLGYGFLMKEKEERNLYSFLLLFLAFVNFGMNIPSLGGRFQILFFLFATSYIFLFFLKLPYNRINLLSIVGIVPMLLYALITFRQGSESINAWLLTPGFGLPWISTEVSLYQILF